MRDIYREWNAVNKVDKHISRELLSKSMRDCVKEDTVIKDISSGLSDKGGKKLIVLTKIKLRNRSAWSQISLCFYWIIFF